jgi:curli biogenesis system outer membrane secretion channel CsgG
MKKMVSVLIAAVVCAAALSCGSSGTPKVSAGSDGSGAVVVTDALIKQVYQDLSGNLTAGLRIALIPVYPGPEVDDKTAAYVSEQLEVQFSNSQNYDILTREFINKVIQEQNFQMDYVDNASAVQLGKLLGAQVIVIGNFEGKGINQRIVMRALEINTGRLAAMIMRYPADTPDNRARIESARGAAKNLNTALAGKVGARAGTAFFPLTVRSGVSADDGNFLFDVMSVELATAGNLSLIEKQKLLALLDEYDFQMSGMVGVKTIGQLLNADVVIFGIARSGGIELVAVDVAKFTVLAQVSQGSQGGS